MRILLFNLFVSLFFCTNLFAQEEIGLQKIKDQCILGEELSFAIIVSSPKQITEDFSEFKFNGVLMNMKKTPTISSSFQSINGKITTSETYKYEYIFTFTPTNEGQFILPALSFKINEKTHQTQAMTFIVKAMPFTENFATFLNIKGQREFYYPSEIVELEIVFALKNFKEFGAIPVLSGFDWLENQGLHYLPYSELNQKIMINSREYPIFLRNKSETIPFGNYESMLSFILKFRVIKSGIYRVDNCIVKSQANTGNYSNQVDFFGRRIKQTVAVYCKSNQLKFEVKDLPEKNKPADFSGAIGSFNIEVVSSTDTDLKVGDPTTLHINIIGEGAWEFVNCPDLLKIPAITDFFRLGNDMPAGVVTEDLRRKEFNVKLRVKSTAIKEIPAIPFSYFDISKGQYITKYSKPIPIKVFANSNKVEVLTFDKDEGKQVQKPDSEIENTGLFEVPKLEPLKPIEVMDVFKGILLNENHRVNYLHLYLSFVCLGLVILILLTRKVLNSSALVKAQIELNIKNSNSKCIKRLNELENHINEGDIIHKKINDCLDDFFKIKYLGKNYYNGLNIDSFRNLIKNGLIIPSVGSQLMEIFEKWEALKFSKAEYDSAEVKSILIDFQKVVSKC